MADDMFDFQQALSELQMSEAELQNLVARGDLRAFRSGGTMKFRREDLDTIKGERETEPTIIIPPGEPSLHDSGPIAIDLGDAEMAAVPVGLEESVGDTGMEMAIEDPALEILPTQESDDAQSAEEITIIAPDAIDEQEFDTGTEAEITIVDEESAVPPEAIEDQAPMEPDRRAVSARVSSIRHRAVYEEAHGHPVMSILMALTAAVLFFTLSIFAVWLWKGIWRQHYGLGGGERFVPSYLEGMELEAEKWSLPKADPEEAAPEGEAPAEDTGAADAAAG